MYHIAEIKKINGSNLIKRFGMNIRVNKSGSLKLTFKFLKNSISSKKLKITPKHKNIKITFIIVLRKPDIKY